jgi:hypothetical protein
MATLETQYKNYLSHNPESKFTFEEWREYMAKNIEKSISRLIEENDLCEKHWIRKSEGTCLKCLEENNK